MYLLCCYGSRKKDKEARECKQMVFFGCYMTVLISAIVVTILSHGAAAACVATGAAAVSTCDVGWDVLCACIKRQGARRASEFLHDETPD